MSRRLGLAPGTPDPPPVRRAGPILLAGALLAVTAPCRAGAEPHRLGIAPLEADLEAMRRTVRALGEAIERRRPERVLELAAPDLPEPARRAVLEAARGRVESLPAGARYSLRTDLGAGAAVPIAPERVQVQVRSEVSPAGAAEGGMVYLELEAVERAGRRRWAIRSLRFAGIATGPAAGSTAGLIAAGVAAGAAISGLGLLLLRRLRRRRGRAPGRA